VRCIDTIQSALDQNSTLEELNIRKKVVFQRNKHTSKLELVKGRKFLHSANQPKEESDSESDNDDGVDSFQASPAKRQKVGNSSNEN
jgi:hypothetical protein